MSFDQSLSDSLSQIELVTGAQLAYASLKSAKTWGLRKVYGKDLFSILVSFSSRLITPILHNYFP
jgi:hypothetical protein